MGNDWPTKMIDQFAQVKSGKRLPKGHSLSESPTLHPYVRLVDIKSHRIHQGDMKYLEEATQEKIARYIVNTGDICLAIVGHTIGLVFHVDDEWDGANLTENAARITQLDGVDPKYLFYYLTSVLGQHEIKKRIVGSAQGKLPLYQIKAMPIPILPLSRQKGIADILGTLDDKIELNRRMNETLEAMARRLFKSWFVDFDPVRAKVALRKKHPKWTNADSAAKRCRNSTPRSPGCSRMSWWNRSWGRFRRGGELERWVMLLR